MSMQAFGYGAGELADLQIVVNLKRRIRMCRDRNEVGLELARSDDGRRTWTIVTGESVSRTYAERLLSPIAANRDIRWLAEGASVAGLSGPQCKRGRIIGVGGGSVADRCKLLSRQTGQPWILVPTLLASDGLLSPNVTVYDFQTCQTAYGDLPSLVLVDMRLLSNAPFEFLASAAADMLSNALVLEEWQPANRRERLAAALSRSALDLIQNSAPNLQDGSHSSVRRVLRGIVWSGAAMILARSSQPCSGSEHLIYHAIRLSFPTRRFLHGQCVASAARFLLAMRHGVPARLEAALAAIGVPRAVPGLEDLTPSDIGNVFSVASALRGERRLWIHKTTPSELAQLYLNYVGQTREVSLNSREQ